MKYFLFMNSHDDSIEIDTINISLQEEADYAKRYYELRKDDDEDKYNLYGNNDNKKNDRKRNFDEVDKQDETDADISCKKKKDDGSIENMMELCKCPICFDFQDSNCKTCTNGHSICSQCYTDIRKTKGNYSSINCPQCHAGFMNYKQVLYTQIYEALQFNTECNYEGCNEVININKYWDHKEKCDYKPLNCYFSPSCHYVNDLDVKSITDHYRIKHFYTIKEPIDNRIKIPFINTNGNNSYIPQFEDTNILVPFVNDKYVILLNLKNKMQISMKITNTITEQIYVYSIYYKVLPIYNNIFPASFHYELRGKDKVIASNYMMMSGNISFTSSQAEFSDMELVDNYLCLNLVFKPLI